MKSPENHIEMWAKTAKLRQQIDATPLSFLNRIRTSISLSGKVDRFFIRHLKCNRDSKKIILDVGCGGGRPYLRKHGMVYGIDPSQELLNLAARIYDSTFLGVGHNMPFENETFDYILSYDVIGHIPVDGKDRFLTEMYRVLKHGGLMLNVIETVADSCWWRFASKQPELFQKYFVEIPGHVGLETASEILSRIKQVGFKKIEIKNLAININECGLWNIFFGDKGWKLNWWFRLLTYLDKLASHYLIVREFINVLLCPLACMECRMSSIDKACGLLTAHTK